jgi:hypothetical protein
MEHNYVRERLERLLYPRPGFRWGAFIASPESKDRSPAALAMRSTLDAADKQLSWSYALDHGVSHQPNPESCDSLRRIVEEAVECLPVREDWLRLLNLVQSLAQQNVSRSA